MAKAILRVYPVYLMPIQALYVLKLKINTSKFNLSLCAEFYNSFESFQLCIIPFQHITKIIDICLSATF